jgi:hypothetical protein
MSARLPRNFVVLGIMTLALRAVVGDPAHAQDTPQTSAAPLATPEDANSPLSISYLAIFYGPSVTSPNSFQPGLDGTPDRTSPLLVKNFAGIGYDLDENFQVSASAYWAWWPVLGQQLQMRDPFLRVADSHLVRSGGFNLYTDLRFHFGVSSISRYFDQLWGVQTFQAATYEIPETRLTVGLYNSVRANFFGGQGLGSDLELYFTPNATYQLAPTVALTTLLEFNGSHTFGDRPFLFVNDGTDLEPGVSWDITQKLNFNPYLHLPLSNVALNTTSVGFMLYWRML